MRRRKRRAGYRRPSFTVAQVLAWADAFHERTGGWPHCDSGRIWGCPGETWRRVDNALRLGLRGLPSGSSLARLLDEQRGVRNTMALPRLSVKQILVWADVHYKKKGRWPKETSGAVADAPQESWHAIDRALRAGVRGLPGGTSLARVLAQHRGVRNVQSLPRLTVKQILTWADAHHRRTGKWPISNGGAVDGVTGESWSGINSALKIGRRGLPGGSSLPRLLAQKRGVRNPKDPSPLTVPEILRWAERHRRRTGRWPAWSSGPVAGVPGETWAMIDRALKHGQRGLKRKTSLYRLLRRQDQAARRTVASR
jgi:hypothetical protein